MLGRGTSKYFGSSQAPKGTGRRGDVSDQVLLSGVEHEIDTMVITSYGVHH